MSDLITEQFRSFVESRRGILLGSFVAAKVPVEEAHELAQESLLRCWSLWESADRPEALLAGIARNVLHEYWHDWYARLRHQFSDAHGERFSVAIQQSRPIRDVRELRRLYLVRTAISSLPERQRQTIELLYLEGLSTREAAHRLGLSRSSLRTCEKRALVSLRRLCGTRDIYSTNPPKR